MNVRVDADGGNAESETADQVGGLSADPRKSKQRRLVRGDLAAILVTEDAADLFELGCLGVVKTGRIDGLSDALDGQRCEPVA